MTQIAARKPPSQLLGEERDIRVEDYLNDKLQTTADLENLDALLENVRGQQGLLKKQVGVHNHAVHESVYVANQKSKNQKIQLREAEETLTEKSNAFQTHSEDLLQQANQFASRQANIDRRLLILTQSETSDDAVRKFDASMQSLQRLDVAKGYFQLLAEVENLR